MWPKIIFCLAQNTSSPTPPPLPACIHRHKLDGGLNFTSMWSWKSAFYYTWGQKARFTPWCLPGINGGEFYLTPEFTQKHFKKQKKIPADEVKMCVCFFVLLGFKCWCYFTPSDILACYLHWVFSSVFALCFLLWSICIFPLQMFLGMCADSPLRFLFL